LEGLFDKDRPSFGHGTHGDAEPGIVETSEIAGIALPTTKIIAGIDTEFSGSGARP